MRLVVLHGPPGVGKLTVGRELAALTGYALFHNHLAVDLVHALFEFGTTPFRELREHIWLDVLGRAAEEDVPGVIFTLVFEPSLLPGFFDRLRERVESVGGSLHPFELRCSDRGESASHRSTRPRDVSQEHRRWLPGRGAARAPLRCAA